jgi:hypothetical protein
MEKIKLAIGAGLALHEGILDFRSVSGSIKNLDGRSTLLLYGGGMFYTDLSLEDIAAKKSEADSDIHSRGPKPVEKKFNNITVGTKSFRVDIHSFKLADEKEKISLILHANFLVKDPILTMVIESIIGVESMYSWSNKYDSSISIGEMFDPETVRSAVEERLQLFLQEEEEV